MKILLATDGSTFSEAATQSVVKQFRPQGTQVRVLSVVEPISVSAPPQMAPRYHPELESEISEAKQLVQRIANQLAEAGFEVSTSVTSGDAKTSILDEAAEWKADLIVVGSHGRKGARRFLLGSVSEAIARHTTCSVEIVRTPSE